MNAMNAMNAFSPTQADAASALGTGVYIHVPFCASKCAYCDFYSRVRRDQKEGYLSALTAEIRRASAESLRTGSLFFGGGTPSLLEKEDFERIFSALSGSLPILPGAEITLEANPETVSPDSLRTLRSLGFNRISFGVQSAVDRELRALGRRHTFARAKEAFLAAQEAGFDNISLDLMLGIPFQTAESLDATLSEVLALRPQHLSCYLLKIEEGTPFYRRHAEKDCASDDETADFYLTVCRTLAKAGYHHYEISNFALPGFESRHNLKYWRDEPYLGFGPAAHSCLHEKRLYNPSDLDRYLASDGDCALSEDDAPAGTADERLMLGLRLSEGISLSYIARKAPDFTPSRQRSFSEKAAPFVRAGLMEGDGEHFSLTERGMLVSNMLLAELLDW